MIKQFEKDSFWFETVEPGGGEGPAYYFQSPRQVHVLEDPKDLGDYFRHLDILRRQYYLAGFLSYELGYLLEPAAGPPPKTSFPYAYFAAYDAPASKPAPFTEPKAKGRIAKLKLDTGYKEYARNIAAIKRQLAAGNIYQANYTIKYKFSFRGSPLSLYHELKDKQQVAYNVFASAGEYQIISTSPELFFSVENGQLQARPMKGTVARGLSSADDACNRNFLAKDEKNRAENLMIVDLLRNDIGRISRAGSVRAKKLFTVEQYPSVFQMTSTIRSRLKEDTSILGMLKAMFPSGSVTGAPKISCMKILRGLEREERKIYTGAVGFFTPDGSAKFNVAIRTILLKGDKGELGVGGGIIIDSRAESEYAEAKLKGNFLTGQPRPEFKLIEALLYDGGLKRLSRHMARLKESARFFGIGLSTTKIRQAIRRYAVKLGKGRFKVRLLVNATGKVSLSHEKRAAARGEYIVGVSKQRTDSADVFLYHKTTNRRRYEQERQKAAKRGQFDVIFCNEREEVTEGTRTNVYVEKDGLLFTPPVECGLLDGTIRRELVRKGKVTQKTIKLKDLQGADAVYISSAIIGLQKAKVSR